jgi:uncharacterized 2Fe-2S/4Fe-4S cluster protein (DUF4445 family)
MARKLTVTYLPSGTTVHVPEGTTVFNAAHWAGLPIESTCGGRGTCGKCGVKVLTGAPDVTLADHRHLADKLDDGWRLSCQCAVADDMEIEVPRLMRTPKAATMGVGRFVLLEPNVQKLLLEPGVPEVHDPRSHLRRLQDALAEEGLEVRHTSRVYPAMAHAFQRVIDYGERRVTATIVGEHLVDVEPGDTTERMFGVAIDLGTTTVVATVIDLRTGAAAGVANTINEQAPYGADVISRMSHAMTVDEGTGQLRAAAVSTLQRLIEEAATEAAVDHTRELYEVVLVGNATMLHLLLGTDPRSFSQSPFVATFLEPQDLTAEEVGLAIHPEGRVSLFPSVGAYVGADIVADMVATGIAREGTMRLLVDVGTNGEIACGSEERVMTTASPAGPAFEGGQILHGMRATEGAIEGIVLEHGEVELQVIGGDVPAAGICGSGLIDAVAQLRLVELLDKSGRFVSREEAAAAGHPLAERIIERDGIKSFAFTDEVWLTQTDVRTLQFAKGAISTGIEIAMRELGLRAEDLDEVLLAGSFGTYINPQSARLIGLVPPVPVERIKAVGNTASEGAKMALTSFREREIAFELPSFVEYVELSAVEDFNDRFMDNLGFPALEEVLAPAGASPGAASEGQG